MKLDPNKEYVYRNGEKPWKIILDMPNNHILSIDKKGNTWLHFQDGGVRHLSSSQTHPLDLIEVKPKIKGWVNVYPKAKSSPDKSFNAVPCGLVYATRKHADEAGTEERIACIEIEFTEGEGL